MEMGSIDSITEASLFMRTRRLVIFLLLGCVGSVHAQSLPNVCHVTSSYDLSVTQDKLIFDRQGPAPRQVVMGNDAMLVDGQPVQLSSNEQDRINFFQFNVRQLVPRVKSVAQYGLSLASQAIYLDLQDIRLDADSRYQLKYRLNASIGDLQQRIQDSQSTRDWHGDAFNQYTNQIVENIAPIVTEGLGKQIAAATAKGDLSTAADLTERAANLATRFQGDVEQHLQPLQPKIEALCPAVRQLAELQQGLHDSRGVPLGLLQLDP
jgi:hypothetical protein